MPEGHQGPLTILTMNNKDLDQRRQGFQAFLPCCVEEICKALTYSDDRGLLRDSESNPPKFHWEAFGTLTNIGPYWTFVGWGWENEDALYTAVEPASIL